MIKFYAFMTRRDDMTRDEFIDYYENSHTPLIVANIPEPSDSRRNFPMWNDGDAEAIGAPHFDVVTAVTHESQAHFDDSVKAYRSPPFGDVVNEDELRFLNRDRTWVLPADEVIDQAPESEWYVGPPVSSRAKLLRLTEAPEALDSEEFRATYETYQAPEVRSLIAGSTDYRRNYFQTSHPYSFMTDTFKADLNGHTWDLFEEFSFSDAASAAAAATALNGAALAKPLAGASQTSVIVCDQYSSTAAATSTPK